MAVKEKILELFEENKEIYFSGEEMAQRLAVSRAAVWKAVTALRKEGYPIQALPHKGYCLSEKTDILSLQGIVKYLKPQYKKLPITLLPETDSTNTWMREQADSGAAEHSVVVTQEQTAGRGRRGREFFSPKDSGLYMSFLFRPENCAASEALRFTTMAAAALCEAVREESGEKAEIKWVNDILIDGKKVSGILTEASLNLENGLVEYIVLGAGINLYPPKDGFPPEIADIAGVVSAVQQNDLKNRLTAAFMNRLFDYEQAKNPKVYTDKYREYSLAAGRVVTVLGADGERKAFVTGMDDQCRLLVQYEDNGREDVLSCGEIRIRI